MTAISLNPEQNNRNAKIKQWAKFVLKLIISGIAMYFVYKKTDIASIKKALQHIHIGYLILGVVAFNFSKWISIFRLRELLKILEINITHNYNWKLYYIGAFYNLFLPGSVGGDGYKVYLLHKRYDKPIKHILSAVFLDRISGLAALVFITGIMSVLFSTDIPYFVWIGIITSVIIYPLYYFFLRIFFKKYTSGFHKTNLISFASQAFQVVTAWCILKGLGVDEFMWNYLILFMLSSLASVIPITPGGLGSREFVSMIGYTYLGVLKEPAVISATLFFIITALSSLVGLVFYFTNMEKKNINF